MRPTYNVLLLGSGGRECAIAYKIAKAHPERSYDVKLYIAPGNAGTMEYGTNIDIKPTDFDAVTAILDSKNIDLVIAGNEDPLVAGLRGCVESYNSSTGKNVLMMGPGADGAQLEGSKDFAKEFMMRYNIPTARYLSVTADTISQGEAFLESLSAPYVLKADGLAAGKGVLILPTLEEAKEELRNMLDGMFGKASAKVVIEEFLSGIECSVFVVTDGTGNYRLLPAAKDYKRIGEGDTGLNTGGMGAVSPVPFVDDVFLSKIEKRIVRPTLDGLRSEGIDYRGIIFLGLINVGGEPMVIEYNVRLGDPETEAVLPRVTSDLLEVFKAVAEGNLSDVELTIDSRAAVTVMAVSGGYPGSYPKGKEIAIGEMPHPDMVAFHAGTAIKDGKVVTSGGRVIAVTALGEDIPSARKSAFDGVAAINFEGKYFRRDIALDLLSKS